MQPKELLEIMHLAERLKDTTRHCYTSKGRHESVAEHSWRISLMAYFLEDAFPEADINKVIKMCIIHDLGEAFTGDIPSFYKTKADEAKEEAVLYQWVDSLPQPYARQMRELFPVRAGGISASLRCISGNFFRGKFPSLCHRY